MSNFIRDNMNEESFKKEAIRLRAVNSKLTAQLKPMRTFKRLYMEECKRTDLLKARVEQLEKGEV